MPEFTEFPIPRLDVASTSSSQKTAIRMALGVPAAADLSNVDNTSDANKPVSTATQSALDTEAVTRLAADNRRAFAGAVAFDGVSGELAIPQFDFKDGTTLSFWADLSDNTLRSFFGGAGANPRFVTNSSGGLLIADNGGSAANDAANYIIPTGVHHFTFIRDSGNLLVYVDGDLARTISLSGVGTLSLTRFGADGSGNYDNLWGSVGKLAPFNRALSATEALELSEIGIEAWLARYPADKWGGGTAYSQDFSGLAVDSWYLLGGGFGSITAASGSLEATTTGTAALSGILRNDTLPINRRYRMTCTVVTDVTDLTYVGYRKSTSGLMGSVAVVNDGVTVNQVSIDFYAEVGDPGSSSTFARASLAFSNESTNITALGGTAAQTITVDDIVITDLGALAAYPMTEGNGRQLRDLSGRYDALLRATGYQHLKPKSEGYVRVKGADANPSIMMLEDSDIIPADAVWTQIIAEERIVDIANTAQDLADRRVRLADSTGDLIIQRSDGTTHATLGTVTAPTDTDDVDIEVHYKQVIR